MIAIAVLFAASAGAAHEATLSVRNDEEVREGGRPSLVIEGLPEALVGALEERRPTSAEWSAFFSLHLESGAGPTVAARHRIEEGSLVLEPRFPLEGGLDYIALFQPRALHELLPDSLPAPVSATRSLRLELAVPRLERVAATEVEAVFPSSDVLPENLLKLYLHFSAPMSQGDAYRWVDIVDHEDRVVELALIELEHELWDPSGTRLTLLFDPGRIKSGLKPKREVGPALDEGHDFALVVDAAWPDAEGSPLREPFRKTFRVSEPDYDSPDPESWRWQRPTAGSLEPFVVTLDEPLDRALLARWIWIVGPNGESLDGRVEIGEQETRWTFTPERPWAIGNHEVRVDLRLEDRAGNSLGRPFEVDLETGRPVAEAEPVWHWRFRPKSP